MYANVVKGNIGADNKVTDEKMKLRCDAASDQC